MALTLNKSRRAFPLVFKDKKNITEQVLPFLQQVTIVENLEGVFDEATLKFDNKNNLFLRKDWAFDKGTKLEIGVTTLNWESAEEGIINKTIGHYNVDVKKFNFKNANIKCISAPLKAKNQENSNIYNQISLKELGSKIANKYKLEYFYEGPEIIMEDVKQEKTTDFSFLNEIADKEGIKLKVTNSKLVLFEEEKLLKKESIKTFSIDYFTDFEIDDKSNEIYDAIELTYYHAIEDEEKRVILTKDQLEGRENKEYEKLLKRKVRAKDNNFNKLAKNLLNKANRKEITIKFKTIGYLNLYTGAVITIVDAAQYNGKYLITKITYNLPKFEIEVEGYKIKRSDNND